MEEPVQLIGKKGDNRWTSKAYYLAAREAYPDAVDDGEVIYDWIVEPEAGEPRKMRDILHVVSEFIPHSICIHLSWPGIGKTQKLHFLYKYALFMWGSFLKSVCPQGLDIGSENNNYTWCMF